MITGSSSKNDFPGAAPSEVKAKQADRQHLTPLKTKLCIPPLRSKWITRSRLVNRMDAGFVSKLTLISAPAGFGKTSLLADWVHRQKIPAAWFSVDKADNDPLNFLTYIILALQTVKTDTGHAGTR